MSGIHGLGGQNYDWLSQIRDQEATSGVDTAWSQDQITFTPAGLPVILSYNKSAAHPTLLPPSQNPSASTPTPNPPETLTQSYFAELTRQFDALSSSYGLTENQQKLLNYYFNEGITPTDPFYAKLLKELDQSVVDNLSKNYELPAGWEKPSTKESYEKKLSSSYNDIFEKQLSQYAKEHNLSENEIASLRFAHYFPENGNPSVKASLAAIEKNTLTELQQTTGVPENYTPTVDKTTYQAQMMASFDQSVEDKIREYGREQGLSEKEVSQLIFLHYNPTSSFEGSDNLKNILGGIEKSVHDALAGQYGMPENFAVPSGSFAYKDVVEGDFLYQFEQNLNAQDPPLTEAMLTQIKEALKDLSNPNISPDVKATIEKIRSQTLAQIRESYGLPNDYSFDMDLSKIGNRDFGSQLQLNALKQAEDGLAVLKAFADSLPPNDPLRPLYGNVIAIITDAILSLKKAIFRAQGADSELAAKYSEASHSQTMDKIDKQKKELDKAQEDKAKQKTTKDWMTALTIILAPLMLLMATTGVGAMVVCAIMIAVIIATAIDTAVSGDKAEKEGAGPIGRLFKAISDGIKDKATSAIVKTLIAAVLTAVAAACGCGPTVGIACFSQLFFSPGVLKEFLEGCGVKEQDAAIASMVIEITFQVATLVGIQVAVSKSPEMANDITQTAEKLSRILKKQVTAKELTTWMHYLGVAQTAGSLTQSSVSMSSNLLQAQAALRRGDVEAYVNEMNAMIRMLKKLLDKLLDGLQGAAAEVTQFSDLLRDLFRGLSETMTKLGGSLKT